MELDQTDDIWIEFSSLMYLPLNIVNLNGYEVVWKVKKVFNRLWTRYGQTSGKISGEKFSVKEQLF